MRHPGHLHQGRHCAGQIIRVDGSARAKCCWPYDQMTNDQSNHLPVERVSSKVVHFFLHFITKHQSLGDREKNYTHDITDITVTSTNSVPLLTTFSALSVPPAASSRQLICSHRCSWMDGVRGRFFKFLIPNGAALNNNNHLL